jgi:hypothetical protein
MRFSAISAFVLGVGIVLGGMTSAAQAYVAPVSGSTSELAACYARSSATGGKSCGSEYDTQTCNAKCAYLYGSSR